MKPQNIKYVPKEKRTQDPPKNQPKQAAVKQPKRSNKPSIAAWKDRTEQTHKQHMASLEAGEIKCQVALIGSSMFERWKTSGLEPWNASILNSLGIFNAGVGGDKVQNVLWRLEQGLLSNFHPKLVVLQIGTNNIEQDHPEDISNGISVALAKIQEFSPSSLILLLGVLPRNDNPSVNPKVLALNELLATKKTDKIQFHQFTDMILNEDGSVKSELFDDHVHLNTAGYRKWSELLGPLLASLVQ